MRKVRYLFSLFVFTLTLAIPIWLQESNVALADPQFNEVPVSRIVKKDNEEKEEEIKEKNRQFSNNHTTKEWKSKWDGKLRLELWFDINNQLDIEPYSMKIKLQKKNHKGDWVDTGQEFKRKPQDHSKKQEDIVFKNIKKGETYRIFFDGYHFTLKFYAKNRISYNLYHQFPRTYQYNLKADYTLNNGDNDDELQFSFINKNKNKNENLHFNGTVSYKIITDTGKEITQEPTEVNSKENNRKIKIDQFSESEHLPALKNPTDSGTPETKVEVEYVGTIDSMDKDKQQYHISRSFTIKRFKKDLEVNSKHEGSNLKVSAISKQLPESVEDRKWEFKLTDKDGKQLGDTQTPKDKDRKAEATFSHKAFKDKDKATVNVTFTGKMYNVLGTGIILYNATGEKKNINAPPAPAPPPQDNGRDTPPPQDNGGNDQEEESVNKEAKIKINSKILKDENQVEITAKLEKVEEPKGDWTLTFNAGEDGEKKETIKDSQKSSVTKKFSIKDLEKDKVKVVAKFKGKDKKGKINVTKEKQVEIKEDTPSTNEEAKIKLTSNLLENNQVEISAVLENVEEPTGEWTLIFPYNKEDENQNNGHKRTSNQKEITETFDTKEITENEALAYVEFKGKDKDNKIIETKLEEMITLKNDTPPPSDDESDQDETQPNDESQSDEEEVVEEIITPPESPNGQIGGELPKTATNYPVGFITGILLLIGGGIAFYLNRRTS